MQEGCSGSDLCFSNHLFNDLDTEAQKISLTMADGHEIPESILEEIKQKVDNLTFEHSCEKGDFVMIVNRRFLHARSAYD